MLQPGKYRRCAAAYPEFSEAKRLPGGVGDLENDLPGVAHDLGGEVDEHPADRCRVSGHRDDRLTHIHLERLEHKEGQEHRVVPCCILIEALEGERLAGEVFEGPEHQFIGPTIMIGFDDPRGCEKIGTAGVHDEHVDGLSHPHIGVDHHLRAGKGQKLLAVFVVGTQKQCPAKSVPASTPITKLNKVPHLPVVLVAAPSQRINRSDIALHVVIELARSDVADLDVFEEAKKLLVEKAAVEANDDRHIGPVVFADLGHHVADHLLGRLFVIGMLAAAPEDRVDDESSPRELQGPKALDLLVGGLDAVAARRLVVVEDHHVQAQDDDRRLYDTESPEKELLQQASEQKDSRPPERSEEPLESVRGDHRSRRRFDRRRIAAIPTEAVEIHHVSAGAIHEETDHLLENLENRKPFPAFSQRAEQPLHVRFDSNTTQIPHEQRQTATAGDRILGYGNFVDLGVDLCSDSGMISHDFLPPDGLMASQAPHVGFVFGTNMLTHSVGFFMPLNRSI